MDIRCSVGQNLFINALYYHFNIKKQPRKANSLNTNWYAGQFPKLNHFQVANALMVAGRVARTSCH